MEDLSGSPESKRHGSIARVAGFLFDQARLALRELRESGVNLNQGEAGLRILGLPSEEFRRIYPVPDSPANLFPPDGTVAPIHDDTI